ncbi:hypothetical protein GCM10010992_06100 [Cloacibacterium rupense]|uniref:Two component regulator propeller n=1 Tax=Cloacibacterium rupense TaxID=517423 RepID=A0ABQ2NIU0_9FLAO|nr:hypothetical protein GCM10010992_06100 [Cloacibacterium rupense]
MAYRFINFSEKDGISDKFVYNISQDKKNRIWIGTQSGLYLFDGVKFKNIKSDKDIAGHQISNILQNVFVDSSGEIWLSSINALQILNPETQQFRSFNYNIEKLNEAISSNILNFCEAEKENVFVGTMKDYWFFINKKTGKTKHFIPQSQYLSDESKLITKIIKAGNWYYALSNNGIFKFNLNGVIVPIFNFENGKPTKNSFEDGYFNAKINSLILACGIDGIATLNLQTNQISYNTLKEEKTENADNRYFVNLVLPKAGDEIWFSSGTLGIYNLKNKKILSFKNSFQDDYSFKISNICKIFADRENNIWIGSYNGLAMLPWQNFQIKNVTLFNPFAKYFVEPFGSMKIGNEVLIANNTSNGLLWLNEKNEMNLIENPLLKGNFKALNGIQYLTKTKKNQIFGTSSLNLFQVDFQSKKLNYIPIKTSGVLGRIENDNLGNLYIASSNNGFYIYNISNKNLHHFNLWDIDKTIKTNSQNTISPRFKDKNGNIWFGKTESVYQYNPVVKKFKKLANQKAENTGAKIKLSQFFAEDSVGNIWISTNDNGIFKLSKDFKTLLNFNKQNSGLPSDFCGNLFFDKQGFLWIGTLSGLAKFDAKKGKNISVITMQNGLKESNSAVPINFSDDGNVYINHYASLSVIDLNHYQQNLLKPKTTISAIKILDKEIPFSENLKLKYFQNFITIDWFSDVYNNFNQNTFAYKLEGLDKDFVETKSNTISYSNLESGTYTFWVKSANNEGVWGEPTKITFTISAPFWKSWWFYTILGTLIFAGIYFFNRYKINQIKERAKLKTKFAQDIAALEMKALRAQMNPHFIFNSLNSIQNYILKNDSEKASQYLTKFSRLIRLILDHSNQNFITLSSEIQLLTLYIEMEDMRFEKHFESEISVDDNLDAEHILIPSMLIQPSVENAIWHGLLHKNEKGFLKIYFKKIDENLLEVTIEDNGVGRKKAEELRSKTSLRKKSYGTEITKNRIETLNKTSELQTSFEIIDLYNENENAAGTKVLIKIPFQKTML